MEAMTGIGALDEFVISVVPQEYDGQPPVVEFRMDYVPLRVTPERLALGVFLLFRPWISGPLNMAEASSPLLAEAMRRYSGFTRVDLQPVTLGAVPIPAGRRDADVHWIDLWDMGAVLSAGPQPGRFALSVLRSDQATGALRSSSSAAIASNAFVFADSRERQVEVMAAVCCLVAGDLDIADVWLDGSADTMELARLLRNVGLTVRAARP